MLSVKLPTIGVHTTVGDPGKPLIIIPPERSIPLKFNVTVALCEVPGLVVFEYDTVVR